MNPVNENNRYLFIRDNEKPKNEFEMKMEVAREFSKAQQELCDLGYQSKEETAQKINEFWEGLGLLD